MSNVFVGRGLSFGTINDGRRIITIPSGLKLRNGVSKSILKKVMKKRLPKRVLEKKKRGFGPDPLDIWRRELKDYAFQFLPKGNIVKDGYVQKDWLIKVLNRNHNRKTIPEINKIWDCLALEVFLRLFLYNEKLTEW